MLLILVLLSSVLAAVAARAECDACINHKCHSRRPLVLMVNIFDQIAIDQFHNILYVQLKRPGLVPMETISGLTVDHETHVLYNGYDTATVFKIDLDNHNHTETVSYRIYNEAGFMFYKDSLFYTKKCCKGMYVIDTKTDQERSYPILDNYTITEFVVDRYDSLYFVADEILYKFNTTNDQPPEIFMRKKYTLSTVKRGDLYLGDTSLNMIYKMNYETNELTEYAAYATGTIRKFLIDANDNIVFHDSAVFNVYIWQSKHTGCTIVRSHDKYLVKENPNRSSDES